MRECSTGERYEETKTLVRTLQAFRVYRSLEHIRYTFNVRSALLGSSCALVSSCVVGGVYKGKIHSLSQALIEGWPTLLTKCWRGMSYMQQKGTIYLKSALIKAYPSCPDLCCCRLDFTCKRFLFNIVIHGAYYGSNMSSSCTFLLKLALNGRSAHIYGCIPFSTQSESCWSGSKNSLNWFLKSALRAGLDINLLKKY